VTRRAPRSLLSCRGYTIRDVTRQRGTERSQRGRRSTRHAAQWLPTRAVQSRYKAAYNGQRNGQRTVPRMPYNAQRPYAVRYNTCRNIANTVYMPAHAHRTASPGREARPSVQFRFRPLSALVFKVYFLPALRKRSGLRSKTAHVVRKWRLPLVYAPPPERCIMGL
jgi:hypothetical protein